ncbi:hypothetical protein JB92DRAFT_3119320 [Gautieria morchelliformis]|nr:hypothetical protein JB92DRAFT_3119320 [Gautieria morchelliformis]
MEINPLVGQAGCIQLPAVEMELSLSLDDVTRRLKQPPSPKFDDPSSELVDIVFEFTGEFSRDAFAWLKFRSSVMRTAPRFCPWARQDTPPGSPNSMVSGTTVSAATPPAWIAEPMSLSSEERVPFDDRTGKVMYLDEVMERIEQSITRELPGDYPTFTLKADLIRMCLRGWGKPMLDYFESVHDLMNPRVKILVDIHFGKHTHSGLHARVLAIIREQLRLLHETTLQRLNRLLSVEGLPFTLNHMYLKAYKDKFLAHYRDIRRQKAKIRFTQLGTHSLDLTLFLQRFGLSCTPNDLHRLLPDDDLEPALDVVASVRAYFQVAFKRFIDLVTLEVDSEFVRGFDRTIRNALFVGLDIKSSERCASWLQDSPEGVGRRKELLATKQRVELSSFALT